jgi:choline dehydrogenase-like flavoprotein
VVDTLIFTEIVGGNINTGVVMAAEKAAHQIRCDTGFRLRPNKI